MTDPIDRIIRDGTVSAALGNTTVKVSVQRILDYQNRCEQRIARQKESIDRLLAQLEAAHTSSIDLDALVAKGLEQIRAQPDLVTRLVHDSTTTVLSAEEFLRATVLASVLLGQSDAAITRVAEVVWERHLDTPEPVDEAVAALDESVATPDVSMPLGEMRPGHVL